MTPALNIMRMTVLSVLAFAVQPTAALVGQPHQVIAELTDIGSNTGGEDDSIAVNPVRNEIYTTGKQRDLLVISGLTNRVVDAIPIATTRTPAAVAVNTNTGIVYVTDKHTRVFAVDPANRTVPASVQVPFDAGYLAVNPVSNRVYVNQGEDTPGGGPITGYVSVLHGSSLAVLQTINLGNALLVEIDVNSSTNRIYSVNIGDSLKVINGQTNTVAASISLPPHPGQAFGVAVDPIANRAFVGLRFRSELAVIDTATNTEIQRIAGVGGALGPEGVAYNPTTGLVYTANGPEVYVVDVATSSVVESVPLRQGASVRDVQVNPITNVVYAIGRGNVFVISTNTNQLPDCMAAAPSIATISPPNGNMVDVTITGVTDPDGDPVSITIDSIYQDEPVNAIGDGSTGPDASGVGTATAHLRAERSGTPQTPGNGRVYHITFTATDGKGGACTSTVQVCVPHDQGQNSTCIDDGPLFDSTVE